MSENELTSTEINTSAQDPNELRPAPTARSGWIRVSAIAAASALAGGLAAAWYYQKTLNKLQQAQESAESPDFGISEDHVDLDT